MSSFIHISEAVSLAMHGMGIIASSESRISVREIAFRTKASEAHLAKVFQRLVKSGLVKSTRGSKGGLELARSPSDITLYEIYSVLEGPTENLNCLMPDIQCPFKSCIFGGLLHKLNEELIYHFKNHTLEDLLKGKMN